MNSIQGGQPKIEVIGRVDLKPSKVYPDLMELQKSFYLYRHDGVYVEVRKGTLCNGLSLPKVLEKLMPFLRRWFPKWPEWYALIVAHDGMVQEFGGPAAILHSHTESRPLTWGESTKWTKWGLYSLPYTERYERILVPKALKFYGNTNRHIRRLRRKFNASKRSN